MNEEKNPLKLLTEEFRVSYPHLFKPASVVKGDNTNLKFSIEMLFDKTKVKISTLEAPVRAAIIEKWGTDKSEWPKPLLLPFRDGDKPHGKKREVKPEHKGMWVARASSKAEYPPSVVGRNSSVALTKESDVYPGCYARADLKAFAYSFAGKDGVTFILDAVQFIRKGPALGGKKPADQVFGNIEGEEDELTDMTTDNYDGAETSEQENFL